MRRERVGSPTRWLNPSLRLSLRLLRSPAGAGMGMRMLQRATITARKERAFTKKQGPVPARARSRAAMAGPIARERLNCSEFRATALGMEAAGTMLVSTA